jgi:NAD(P)-dependent dehydrogenase (short-subunit alcohol dehydrogenase family)
MHARVPVKRFLPPKEIADLAMYLASGESDGMSGQTLLLDGGMLRVRHRHARPSRLSRAA